MKTTIRTKLIATSILLIIFSVLASVVPVMILVTSEFEENYMSKIAQGSESFVRMVEELKTESKKLAILLASYPGLGQAITAKNPEQINLLLKSALNEMKVNFVTVTDQDGIVVARTHSDKLGDSVISQKNVQMALADNPTPNIEPGNVVRLSVRTGAPVKDAQGKIIGVVSTGFNLSDTNDFVDEAKNRYGFEATIFHNDERITTTVVDNSGKRATGTKSATNIAKTVLEEHKQYVGKIDIFGKEHLTIYKPLLNSEQKVIGMLFTGQDISLFRQTQQYLMFVVIVITLVIILTGTGLVFLLADRVCRPIRAITEAVDRVSDGDLSQKVKVYASGDEIETLSKGFNKMVEQLKQIIVELTEDANRVFSSSQNLASASDLSSRAAEKVTLSIFEVANDASKQKQILDESISVIDRISNNIDLINNITGKAVGNVQTAAKLAGDGTQSIQSVIDQMHKIEATVTNSSEAISKLGERSKEISQIVDTISAIASQTNLLALNAAIEAARAGEGGRGFAVVAEEVRKLAEQSQLAARQIAQLISHVQSETERAILTMSEGAKETRIGSEVVTSAGRAFTQIAVSVERTTAEVQDISSAVHILDEDSQKMVSGMNIINKSSAQNLEHAAAVSTASQEQLASMQEITAAIGGLTDLSEKLQAIVKEFRL